jgi:hypothetical protein
MQFCSHMHWLALWPLSAWAQVQIPGVQRDLILRQNTTCLEGLGRCKNTRGAAWKASLSGLLGSQYPWIYVKCTPQWTVNGHRPSPPICFGANKWEGWPRADVCCQTGLVSAAWLAISARIVSVWRWQSERPESADAGKPSSTDGRRKTLL